MLNTVYFITANYKHFTDTLDEPVPDNFYLSFLADGYQYEKLQETYCFFSENKFCNLSLSFIITKSLQPICIQSILSFFFIPDYGNVQKEVNIICANKILYNETAAALKAAAKMQGIDNLLINLLEDPEKTNTNNFNEINLVNRLYINEDKIIASYQQVNNNLLFNNSKFYLYQDELEPVKLIKALNLIDHQFKNTYPDVYKMVLNKLAVTKEIELLKIKNLYLQNELENYIHHNNLLRSTHNGTEIQQYYDSEYEVLPGWFKKAGHLLKVVTGKRTWSSLLNKNIKNFKV